MTLFQPEAQCLMIQANILIHLLKKNLNSKQHQTNLHNLQCHIFHIWFGV